MKIITEPKVYLVGRQTTDDSAIWRFLHEAGAPNWHTDTKKPAQELCEVAGRLCYQSFANPRPGGNAAYLKRILEVGHGSVLEHAAWNLIITGVSRSLSKELLRHRAGLSPSELSQRYVDCSDVAFVAPPALRETVHDAMRIFFDHWDAPKFDCVELSCLRSQGINSRGLEWLACMINAEAAYAKLTDYLAVLAPTELSGTDRRKWARQAARSVLPECTETKIMITVNARALRHIIEQRCSRHADAEIRRLAGVLLDVMQNESPNLFGDYTKTQLPDGSFEATTSYRKV